MDGIKVACIDTMDDLVVNVPWKFLGMNMYTYYTRFSWKNIQSITVRVCGG